MKLHRLYREQWLPLDTQAAWRFFSNPKNLEEITPPWLNFSMDSPGKERMYAGMILKYRIRLPGGVPTQWITEITHVREPEFFVDEQRIGPYRFWHHQHRFHPERGGVRMEDEVHYGLPLGWLGNMAHALWVKNQLRAIFDFRFQHLARRFPDKNSMN